MKVSVSEAARRLEEKGLLKRERHDHSERVIAHVAQLLGRNLHEDLEAFYREMILSVDGYSFISPHWNDWMGWRTPDEVVTRLLHAEAIPICYDGCGSIYGLDLTAGVETPAVYFFDHEDGYEIPNWAAGSSLGAFLLLFADRDRAFEEKWPPRWELTIDADIDHCPRARAIWAAG